MLIGDGLLLCLSAENFCTHHVFVTFGQRLLDGRRNINRWHSFHRTAVRHFLHVVRRDSRDLRHGYLGSQLLYIGRRSNRNRR